MSSLGKFLSLSPKKQKIIIDAALTFFGTNGYKKTSINDIAKEAGISKALVFHYFGTKKALYFYLIEISTNNIQNELKEKFDTTITDFFDRIKLSADIEISIMKKHPALLSFLKSVYFETHKEVREKIQNLLSNNESEKLRNKILFENINTSKFKVGVDPKFVMEILTNFVDGYLSKRPFKTEADLDALCEEFDKCLTLFKNNFYKEEYL